MKIKYLVVDIQTWDTGTITTPTYAYDNRNSAESKYHAILSSAAVTTLPCEAAVLVTSEGQILDHAMYRHETEPAEES